MELHESPHAKSQLADRVVSEAEKRAHVDRRRRREHDHALATLRSQLAAQDLALKASAKEQFAVSAAEMHSQLESAPGLRAQRDDFGRSAATRSVRTSPCQHPPVRADGSASGARRFQTRRAPDVQLERSARTSGRQPRRGLHRSRRRQHVRRSGLMDSERRSKIRRPGAARLHTVEAQAMNFRRPGGDGRSAPSPSPTSRESD